jgi:hypothetical protein
MKLEVTFNPSKERPYRVVVMNETWMSRLVLYDWCSESFGVRNKQYNNPRWWSDDINYTFWFKHEKDLNWFIMRWQ